LLAGKALRGRYLIQLHPDTGQFRRFKKNPVFLR